MASSPHSCRENSYLPWVKEQVGIWSPGYCDSTFPQVCDSNSLLFCFETFPHTCLLYFCLRIFNLGLFSAIGMLLFLGSILNITSMHLTVPLISPKCVSFIHFCCAINSWLHDNFKFSGRKTEVFLGKVLPLPPSCNSNSVTVFFNSYLDLSPGADIFQLSTATYFILIFVPLCW